MASYLTRTGRERVGREEMEGNEWCRAKHRGTGESGEEREGRQLRRKERRTERQTERKNTQTNRQTDKQTDRAATLCGICLVSKQCMYSSVHSHM